MSNSNVKQYEDNELKDIYYLKIKNLSLVGKTNKYSDLDNIPKTFEPSEHLENHPIVDENNNGIVTPDIIKKIKEANRNIFKFIRFIQDNNFGNLDITEDINYFRINSGQSFNIKGNNLEDTISMIGDKLVIPGFIPEPGPPGDPGRDGDNGALWIPTMDENSKIIWTLIKEPTEEILEQKFRLLGLQGPQGLQGPKGKQNTIADIIDNPIINGINLQILYFSKDNTFTSKTIVTIITEETEFEIAYKGYQRFRFARMFKDSIPYVYNVKDKYFYGYIDQCEGYGKRFNESPFEIEEKIPPNSFVYSNRTKYFFYVNERYDFILL